MKHHIVVLALLGLLAFLVTLFPRAPANWVAGAVSGGPVSLHGARGTAWQGEAQVLAGRVAVGGLRWTLSPLSLLTLSPALTFELAGDDILVEGRVRHRAVGSRTELADLRGDVAMALLAAITGEERLIDANISLDSLAMTFTDGRAASVSGSLRLNAVTITRPERRRLGDYGLRVETVDEGFRAVVLDSAGALTATGYATVRLDGAWTLDLRLRTADRDIIRALDVLGEQDPDGSWPLFLRGSLNR